MKRKTLVIITLFFFSFLAILQRHEIGIQLEPVISQEILARPSILIHYQMEVALQRINFLLYGAIMYRMNFNPYQSVRFRLAYNHISFDDRYAQELYRFNRRAVGSNSVYEASAYF